MKNAIGGIFNINVIVILLLLATGLLMFSFNYVKAFRVKNEIRRIVEQYEGVSSDALTKIDNVVDKYNYSLSDPVGYVNVCNRLDGDYKAYRNKDGVFCVKCTLVNEEGTDKGKIKYKGAYYTIVTFVDINVPIIRNVFPKAAGFLRVAGETSLIYSSGNNSEVCRFAEID